jgi:RNA polymerase sigma-70 factor (ECF subfamily)
VTSHSGNTGYGAGPDAPSSTSSSLLERVKARQPEAWGRLVDLYAPLVYRWCRQLGLRAADAGDVVQEVFGSVVSSIDDFRGSEHRGSFRAWLRSITRHRVSDHFRRQHGQPEAVGGSSVQQELRQLPQPDGPPSASDSTHSEDPLWRRALELVRAEFEDRTWRAFWRVVVDAQRPADVADELGMTIHAVYKAKSRVLRRVRQQLGDLEPEI